jgi:hypothetical protein
MTNTEENPQVKTSIENLKKSATAITKVAHRLESIERVLNKTKRGELILLDCAKTEIPEIPVRMGAFDGTEEGISGDPSIKFKPNSFAYVFRDPENGKCSLIKGVDERLLYADMVVGSIRRNIGYSRPFSLPRVHRVRTSKEESMANEILQKYGTSFEQYRSLFK